MLEEAIIQQMKDDTSLSNKLTDGSTFHAYPLRLPEAVDFSTNGYAVTYTLIDGTLNHPLAENALVQFNCIGEDFKKSRDLANDVADLFNDIKDSDLGSGANVKFVNFVKRESKQAIFDDESDLFYQPVEVRFIF